ncbi:hypothetical protein ACN27F_03490 [Solwaraspora sp. WMMB335]|uniref:hypothetical protein n=1 Tax=Solwaraspora sp. WMMB335 TaxID=3404118 RepID=UPI003B949D91
MALVALANLEPPNLPEIAGFYSQLAGVLAGFSFAGLIALVTTKRDGHGGAAPIRHSVLPLTSAFVALVASSLDYALVAGETAGTQRVASLQSIAGMGFSIAGIMLVYSILVLLLDFGATVGGAAIKLLRNLTVLLLPPLLVLLMWGGVRDHLLQKYGADAGFVAADWISLSALTVTVVATVGFHFSFSDRRTDQTGRTAQLASVGAQLAFLSLLGSTTLITLTTADTVISDALPVSATLLVCAFCLAIAYSASRYGSQDVQASGADTGGLSRAESAMNKAGDVRMPIHPDHREAVLEALDRPVLTRRSVEIFPQAYLMNISIIQGVALSVMTIETVNFLKTAEREFILPSLAQAALSLAALVIVSYEYLWFTTIMRWTPTFRDTAIPVTLGVAEIVPPMLLGYTTAWWLALSVFAILGAAAFLNTVSRLRVEMFPGHAPVYEAIRRLLRRLAVVCILTSGAGVSAAVLVQRNRNHAPLVSTVSACVIILLSVVVIIGYSESVLNNTYSEYRVGRRPPLFDRLRGSLRDKRLPSTRMGQATRHDAGMSRNESGHGPGLGGVGLTSSPTPDE